MTYEVVRLTQNSLPSGNPLGLGGVNLNGSLCEELHTIFLPISMLTFQKLQKSFGGFTVVFQAIADCYVLHDCLQSFSAGLISMQY